MLQTRLIREVRARQDAVAQDELAELIVEVLGEAFPDLLTAAFKQPEVRTAICNIVAADRRSAIPPAPRRSNPRGGRRV